MFHTESKYEYEHFNVRLFEKYFDLSSTLKQTWVFKK